MPTATMTSKGQITIPKSIRDAFHINPGDRIEFFIDQSGRLIVWPITENITALKGVVDYSGTDVSIEDMNAAIQQRGGKL